MLLSAILQRTNDLLAGETLSYFELRPHFDSVIDDINQQLSTVFPNFTEVSSVTPTGTLTEYVEIPDRYIRSVVCLGAAVHFYMSDEEGGQPPAGYMNKYRENLFYMLRDYLPLVPDSYKAVDTMGALSFDLHGSDHTDIGVAQEDFRI